MGIRVHITLWGTKPDGQVAVPTVSVSSPELATAADAFAEAKALLEEKAAPEIAKADAPAPPPAGD